MIDIREHGGAFAGGKGASLNLYVQPEEPRKKDGIWIKADKKFDRVIMTDEVFDFENGTLEEIPGMPTRPSGSGKSFVVGDYIHVLSGNYHYKYSIINNVWSVLTDNPASVDDSRPVAMHGKYIYMFPTGYGGRDTMRYDIDHDFWESLHRPDDVFRFAIAIPYGKYIYLFGNTNDFRATIRYDTASEEYASLTRSNSDIGEDRSTAQVFYDKAFFASSSTIRQHFDFESEVWGGEGSSGVGVGNMSAGKAANVNHIVFYTDTRDLGAFDILTGNYDDRLLRYPASTGTEIVAIEQDVYIFGRYNSYKYSFPPSGLNQNDVVVFRGGENKVLFETELSTPSISIKGNETKLRSAFTIPQLFHDGEFHEYPAYYGDGGKWSKISLSRLGERD